MRQLNFLILLLITIHVKCYVYSPVFTKRPTVTSIIAATTVPEVLEDKIDSTQIFSENFAKACSMALNGDQSILQQLINSPEVKWSNPYTSSASEVFGALKQVKDFFLDPKLMIFQYVKESDNSFSMEYQLSLTYPIFWRPRIIIPGKIFVKLNNDCSKAVDIVEKWELSLGDIIFKQFFPRIWDIWHLLQSPVSEYPPIRQLTKIRDVSFSILPQTYCIEVIWKGGSNYPGPSILATPGFSLFGKLRTSRPNRDPIYAVLPTEVQCATFFDTKFNENMKQSSWIFHVPTQLQDQIIETAKLGTRTPIVSYDDEVEVESDLIDEVDYQIGLDNIRSPSNDISIRGDGIQLDENMMADFDSKESKEYLYRYIPKRIIASIDIYGEVTQEKISKSLDSIVDVVKTNGKEIFNRNISIKGRDLNNKNDKTPMIGLQHWHCKTCFNPIAQPAMAIYEIQYSRRRTTVFVELI